MIFIDRDGTMGGDARIEYPQDYYNFDGTPEAIEMLNKNGFYPVAFTNQSCIARGKDGGYDFAQEFHSIGMRDYFLCPHDEKDNCECRKPKTALLERAKEKYNLDMSECFVIGDRWSDMLAGGKMGCSLILVLTGWGKDALTKDREKWREYEPSFVANNLLEAAEWLCNNYEG
ncbi:MAG: HAD-IIIA family hydrolase [Acutalibacteraceae bacterium]|nr:HAD-IIIA family hydrolase [Acutalibacteraceae bacterium]